MCALQRNTNEDTSRERPSEKVLNIRNNDVDVRSYDARGIRFIQQGVVLTCVTTESERREWESGTERCRWKQ